VKSIKKAVEAQMEENLNLLLNHNEHLLDINPEVILEEFSIL
jgi:hypothetical protein